VVSQLSQCAFALKASNCLLLIKFCRWGRQLAHGTTTAIGAHGGASSRIAAANAQVENVMKSFKYMLAGATALGLVMAASAALAADNNTLYLTQDGAGNVANVQQSAGPGGNNIGTATSPFRQQGDDNSFTETQATGGGFSRGDNDIVKGSQIGDNNRFSDYYSNNAGGNRINNFLQNGDNNVASVSRNASISGIVGTVSEVGDSNFLSIGQTGTGNEVTNATITGDHNGASTVNLSNWGTYITQSGSYNLITESSITGSNNNPTIFGPGGPVNYINQTGDYNGRTASIARTKGSDGNGISITETGNWNNFNVQQGVSTQSTGNYATVSQTGSYNNATATQFGDFNLLHVNQLGDSNTSTTRFTGDSNGSGTMSGVANALLQGGNPNLVQGQVYQDSTGSVYGNNVSYTVNGNSNLFAFAQVGGGNSITGTVGSDGNQAAVLQVGNFNTASFTQTGGVGNNIAVHQ
jgi:hypothetical protein